MKTEYESALIALQQAQNNFENANLDYVDVAITDVSIAKIRLNNEIKKIRIMRGIQNVIEEEEIKCILIRY